MRPSTRLHVEGDGPGVLRCFATRFGGNALKMRASADVVQFHERSRVATVEADFHANSATWDQ